MDDSSNTYSTLDASFDFNLGIVSVEAMKSSRESLSKRAEKWCGSIAPGCAESLTDLLVKVAREARAEERESIRPVLRRVDGLLRDLHKDNDKYDNLFLAGEAVRSLTKGRRGRGK